MGGGDGGGGSRLVARMVVTGALVDIGSMTLMFRAAPY